MVELGAIEQDDPKGRAKNSSPIEVKAVAMNFNVMADALSARHTSPARPLTDSLNHDRLESPLHDKD